MPLLLLPVLVLIHVEEGSQRRQAKRHPAASTYRRNHDRRSRVGEGAAPRDFDLSAVCDRHLKLIQTYASQNCVQLKEQIEPGVHFPGNEDQIGRLVLNLLKNAVDYNREGGEVLLRLATRNGSLVLEISDTGIGIDGDSIGHIFKRFYKVDDSRARSKSGTGLGLAIVKTIVQAHDGDISVRSRPGEGTTVTVTFDASLRKTSG